MAVDGLLSSGLSAIQTNTAALRVASTNIANVNTPGYNRRVVQQTPLLSGSALAGVSIAKIQRVVDQYLDREVLSAGASSARYDVQSSLMKQLNVSLGEPGDGNSIGSRIDALYAALGQASLDPSSLPLRAGTLSQFDSLARTISELSNSVASLRVTADQQVANTVSDVNSIIQQIYALNAPIKQAMFAGDTATGLLDQRDELVRRLSDLVGVRTNTLDDGRIYVATLDGVQLIGDNYVQLSYQASMGPAFKPITVQTVNPVTGVPIGTPKTFDFHVQSGELRGLLDTRDVDLLGIGEELGAMAQTLALAFNREHNASSAVPPPATMSGRQTGLLATDALTFTGAVTVGLADSSGVLQHKIAIDFDAGTLSVDGGPSAAIGATVGSFVTALNTALGANGSASFTDGALILNATGGSGLIIADDPSVPSMRGGVGFSQFFGLNDLYQASGNAILATGLDAADSHGLAPGGSISLLLKGPQGQRVNEVTVGVTGTTIGDMVTALNTAFSGTASFSLDANGQLQVTPAAAYAGYKLEVTLDSTLRGTTGESFTSLFGLGTGEALARARNFSLTAAIAGQPQRLALAKPSLDATTALGTAVVAAGDNRGLLALQDLINGPQIFAAAGAMPGRTATFSDYTAAFYQDVATRSSAIDANKATQDMRLQLAEQNQSQAEGVNLDEELARMVELQQAYNAGARLITVAKALFDELLNAVDR